jgi:hypothetical protein
MKFAMKKKNKTPGANRPADHAGDGRRDQDRDGHGGDRDRAAHAVGVGEVDARERDHLSED